MNVIDLYLFVGTFGTHSIFQQIYWDVWETKDYSWGGYDYWRVHEN